MKLYNEEGKVAINIKKSKKPALSHHRGRTWDKTYKMIDGKKCEAWYDSTWGKHLYVEIDGVWWSMAILRNEGNSLSRSEQLFTVVAEIS